MLIARILFPLLFVHSDNPLYLTYSKHCGEFLSLLWLLASPEGTCVQHRDGQLDTDLCPSSAALFSAPAWALVPAPCTPRVRPGSPTTAAHDSTDPVLLLNPSSHSSKAFGAILLLQCTHQSQHFCQWTLWLHFPSIGSDQNLL